MTIPVTLTTPTTKRKLSLWGDDDSKPNRHIVLTLDEPVRYPSRRTNPQWMVEFCESVNDAGDDKTLTL